MIDINFIRDNPEKFDKAMEARGCPQRAKEILDLDKIVRIDKQILQLQSEMKNMDAKMFAKLKSAGFGTEEIKNFLNK